MRPLLLFCALLAFLISSPTPGQEPSLPQPESQEPAPDATALPQSPSLPAPMPPQLIPDDILPLPAGAGSLPPASAGVPSLPQLDEVFKQSPLNAISENQRRLLESRQLRNRVANDAELKAARAKAEAAKTDLQKRKLLRRYYEMYFGKLIALASTPELKAYLVNRKNQQLNALPQPRVRPESAAAASPAPVGLTGAQSSPPPTPSPAPVATPQIFPFATPNPLGSP